MTALPSQELPLVMIPFTCLARYLGTYLAFEFIPSMP